MSGFTEAPPKFLSLTCGIKVFIVLVCECGPIQDLLIVLTVIIPNWLILICKIEYIYILAVQIVFGYSFNDGASPSSNLYQSCYNLITHFSISYPVTKALPTIHHLNSDLNINRFDKYNLNDIRLLFCY